MIRWMSEISVVKEGMGHETRMYKKKMENYEIENKKEFEKRTLITQKP